MKRVTLFFFCIILAGFLITAGCVSEDTNTVSGPKWLFSDIVGTVTPETDVSLVDDYHAAVNKEFLSTAQIPEGSLSCWSTSQGEGDIRAKLVDLINNSSITGHDADLVRTYYHAYLDWDQRNADGLKPLERYTRQIEQIQSIDDYRRFVSEYTDPLLSSYADPDVFNSSCNILYINPPYLSLGDSAEYTDLTETGKATKEANAVFFKKMLLRLGYTEEQANKLEEDRIWLESELASALKTNLEWSDYASCYRESISYTIDELKAMLSNYPVEESLSGYIRNGATEVRVVEPAGVKKLNELFIPDNLEKFKAYLLHNYIVGYAPYLDRETQNLLDEQTAAIYGMNYTSDLEKAAYTSVTSQLLVPAEKLYVEYALDPKTKEDVLSMIHTVLGIYHNRLANASWLSEETRAKALEKLDGIRIFAVGPDDWSEIDYTTLSFDGCTSLVDMVDACDEYKREKNYLLPGTLVNKDCWYPTRSTLEQNAFYNPAVNSINILAGYLIDPIYNASASLAMNYGGLGNVIGHEISHAFDSSGSQFDKDGNLNSWWTDADRKAFDEKTKQVADYFSTIEAAPNTYVNGDMTIGETVADLGGMSVMLEAAAALDDFDYDAYFRSNAAGYAVLTSEDQVKYWLEADVHPPGHVRTNAIVQQFDEFYQTYGVKPGDGMYLAPENRLSVW